MKVNKTRNSILLIITALIWGTAFVAQSKGGKAVGPYTFNCIRSLIGGMVLLPVIFILDKMKFNQADKSKLQDKGKPQDKNKTQDKRTLITGGVLCGIMLFLASTMQQLGMYYGTTAGKAGFLTACYILIVPVLGMFFKKKCGVNIWIGVGITLAGLYMLCMKGSFNLKFCDGLVMIGAFLFAIHIMVIDHFSPLTDGVRMSFIQFIVCGILGLIPMFIIDMEHSMKGINEWIPLMTTMEAWGTILYGGVLSCGVGYTLQIIGQKGLNPTIASLLMSLESVFSVIAGCLILGERMSAREITGCILIFSAIIMAQIPVGNRDRKVKG